MKRVLSTSPLTLHINAGDIGRITNAIESLNISGSLTSITFDKQSINGITPLVFLYKISFADGRVWKQTITFTTMSDPYITFQVADLWKLSEFTQQGTVRDALIMLVERYPTVEKFSYTIS